MKLISVDLCSSMTETLLPELVNVALNLTGATKSFSRPSIVVVDIHVAVPDRRIEESTKLVVKVCGWNRARLVKDLVLTRQLNKECVCMIAKTPDFRRLALPPSTSLSSSSFLLISTDGHHCYDVRRLECFVCIYDILGCLVSLFLHEALSHTMYTNEDIYAGL